GSVCDPTTGSSWSTPQSLGQINVGVGNAVTVRIIAKVNDNVAKDTVMTNTATVSSSTSGSVDPVSSNNSSTATTTVDTRADLTVTKSDAPDPVIAGEALTYTITVKNEGPS